MAKQPRGRAAHQALKKILLFDWSEVSRQMADESAKPKELIGKAKKIMAMAMAGAINFSPDELAPWVASIDIGGNTTEESELHWEYFCPAMERAGIQTQNHAELIREFQNLLRELDLIERGCESLGEAEKISLVFAEFGRICQKELENIRQVELENEST